MASVLSFAVNARCFASVGGNRNRRPSPRSRISTAPAGAPGSPVIRSRLQRKVLSSLKVTSTNGVEKLSDTAGAVEMSPAVASDDLAVALKELQMGRPVCILDAADREGETDMFFPAIMLTPAGLRQLRTKAGGELYIAVANDVAKAFGFPYAGDALASAAEQFPVLKGMAKFNGDMCQGSCSVGLSLDHRSTHTGAPDDERSLTCRRLAEMAEEALAQTPTPDVEANAAAFGAEFHVPGHVFMCTEHTLGLGHRQGHTELSVALARAAGVVPVMVGCVMLCNEGDSFGALPPAAAREWAMAAGVPFLDGKAVAKALVQ